MPGWTLAPAVNALQALRGVALISAVTFMAEIGDVRRFETPVKLMACLGLVPSDYSTCKTTRRRLPAQAPARALSGEQPQFDLDPVAPRGSE